jgi:hypothetical protein
MVSFAHGSILKSLWTVFCTLVVLAPLAAGQHPIAPAPHPSGAPVHVSAPPIVHAPVIQTPMMQPPIMHGPIYTPPGNTSVWSAGTLRTVIVRPPLPPIRPRPPVILVYTPPPVLLGGPFWQFNRCWWETCDLFWPYTFSYTSVSSPGPRNYVSQISETPVYVYGYEREDTPQLFLKDGTILNVTDYWLVDGELHFNVIQEAGTKPVEHSIPFHTLDLQKTVDANTKRGFRFMLRNEPFEQYVHDHPEGPPPSLAPPE